MNTLKKINRDTYTLTIEDGRKFTCKTWVEKKKDKNGDPIEYEHVIIPKEARDICGRTYLRTSIVGDFYEFETKTAHREGLGNGGWKSRMTEDEKVRWAELEAEMEQIKSACMNRTMTEEEKVIREMEKLQKKLEEMRAKK